MTISADQSIDPMSAAEFLIGGAIDWTKSGSAACWPVFDPRVLAMLDRLAHRMLADPAVQRQLDAAAFAFWIRRSALERLQDDYRDGACRIGRGTVFHICPGNVPMMAAYCLVVGLLAGCRSLARLPSQTAPDLALTCAHLEAVLAEPDHAGLRPRLGCVRYPRDAATVTAALSASCDVRMIWGGDQTIRAVRAIPLPPGAVELAFPDRYSLAVIDSEAWLSAGTPDAARKFYNDAMQTDQLSCSAPRVLIWTGQRVEEARRSFWRMVADEAAARRRAEAGQVAAALDYAYGVLAAWPDSRLEPVSAGIVRVLGEGHHAATLAGHPGGGVFLESSGADLVALQPWLDRRCQTVSYFGVDPARLAAQVRESGAAGCDRIVPLGQTRAFALVWDGHDLIRTLSRAITLVTPQAGT